VRYGFKAWAERTAAGIRRELRIQPLAALPAQRLADHLGITIVEPAALPGMTDDLLHRLVKEFGHCWSALTIVAEAITIIVCNPTHADTRRESDVMHELAHIICCHTPARIELEDGFPFRLRSFNPNDEAEAVWLGGVLQIPRAALLQLVRRGYVNEALAEHFCASDDMVRFRRNVTGVDTQIRRTPRFS
jgi:Zn-dependent peptidase ImmA (M78 family)